MKSKKSSQRPRPEFVTLNDLEAWLSCRLRWKLTRDQPPDAEPPPWEHLQKCILESLYFYHRERSRLGRMYFPRVQEHFWEAFERQSLAASNRYLHPWDRAKDMRFGESVLEQYVAAANAQAKECIGQNCTWSIRVPGAKLPLQVRADLLFSEKPVRLQVVRGVPDPELAQFHLAPWAAAITAAHQGHCGGPPKQLEAVFLVADESPQVVRLVIPPPPPETMDKLRLWLTAYASGLARGDIFPQPGSHCGYCPFRVPCARWPGKTK